MTLEEKIEQLKVYSLTQARKVGNDIIKEQEDSIEEIKAKRELLNNRQSRSAIESAKEAAKQEGNRLLTKEMLHMRRALTSKVVEYTDGVFDLAKQKLIDFKQTPEYNALLRRWILAAKDYAGDEEIHIYISPCDADKKDELEKETGVDLRISAYDFIGGTRAVIHSRNVLIDHAFSARLDYERENFHFEKGELHA